MSTAETIWLVARREIGARLLTRTNLVSTAIMLVVIVAGVAALAIFGGDDDPTTVAMTEQTAALEPGITQGATAQGLELTVRTMEDAAARDAVSDGEVAALVAGSPSTPEVVVHESLDDQLRGVLAVAAQQQVLSQEITALGGDPAQVAAQLAQAELSVTALSEGGEFDGARYAVAMATLGLLFFGLVGSGTQIAMGVVEEKSSRVVEILLATIRPAQLLAGKILGIGLTTLAQLLLLGGVAAASATAAGLTEGLQVNIGATLLWAVVWFLLGFALFALLFGSFASLVARQEDIGSVTTPLMLLILGPFYLSVFLVPNNPESTLVAVLSQVPFFAPFMMPIRSAFGAVAGWEQALAVALCAVTVPLLVWLAGRIYSRAVLHTGGRLKLRQALGPGH